MLGSLSHPSLKKLNVKPNQTVIWFVLSLFIALLYRLPALYNAFAGEYVVQDDARQHVFWMLRFADPTLFPNDLLADYFQSVAPWGYTTLYRTGGLVGLDIWTLNKILPVPIVLISTVFAFGTVYQLLPIPLAGFITALFLNQNFLVRDDVDSATPAAFFYPIFLAFLYYVLKRSWRPCGISIILLGLFYPQGVLIMVGILALRLLQWQQGRLRLCQNRTDWWLWATGWIAAGAVLLPQASSPSPYGPVLEIAQAQDMLALSSQGWSKFFVADAVGYWLCGKRSGILPFEWCLLDIRGIPVLWLTLVIPLLLAFRGRSPLARVAASRIGIFLQVIAASIFCFTMAHLWLFKLHLPNRYTEHSFRILAAMGVGVAIVLMMEQFTPSSFRGSQNRLMQGLGIWAVVSLLVSFLVAGDEIGNYTQGKFPQLYEYFQAQPKNIVIASLTKETNNLPSFSQRSIFVGAESYTLPYHLGYYTEVKQRTIDLITAQYSLDPVTVEAFLLKYPIDFWLVERTAFTSEWIEESSWLRQYAEDTAAPQMAIQAGQPTALETVAGTCTAFELNAFQVLETDCLRRELKSPVLGSQAKGRN